MIRGDELWVQFLSEPTGGSDLAGAVTRATRDGDVYILNGSKIWSSSAFDCSDYGLCLARTNWDVPKHRGLTMFIVQIHQPGIERRADQAGQRRRSSSARSSSTTSPSRPSDVVGEVNDGWTVASRLLVHERNAIGGGSEFHDMDAGGARPDGAELAVTVSTSPSSPARAASPPTRTAGSSWPRPTCSPPSTASFLRLQTATTLGVLPPAAGSLLKLFGSTAHVRTSDITMELAGSSAVAWPGDERSGGLGVDYLFRQATSILSGTSEIQRNIISERVLGLPRAGSGP